MSGTSSEKQPFHLGEYRRFLERGSTGKTEIGVDAVGPVAVREVRVTAGALVRPGPVLRVCDEG